MKTETILRVLRTFFAERTRCLQTTFHRTLPFGETVVDRWEKARLLGWGEASSVYDSAIVFGDVQVGAHTWVGPQVVLDGAAAPVRIGAWCSISAGTHLYTHDSVGWAVTGGLMEYSSAPVSIGDKVYIGPLCVISKGVSIGEGCIIGAHSYVDKDIPPYSMAFGQPARIKALVKINADGLGYTFTDYEMEDHN